MSANDALADLDNQAAPTVEQPVNVQDDNDPLKIGYMNSTILSEEKEKGTQKTETQADKAVSQPQSKDERHAAQKITELSEQRISFARLAVEHSGDAIYDIAEKDPKIAEKLLQEYEYGTESVEELLALRDNPKEDKEDVIRQVQTDSKIKELENRVLDETIKRLRRDHPDLTGELEEEFRGMYSDPHFAKYDETQKISIARAASGKPVQQQSDQVLLDVLKQHEGSFSSSASVTAEETRNLIPDHRRDIYERAGVSEADMKKYLPKNIEDVIEKAYTRSGKKK